MATIRRAGFGTVFELEDSKVGIGTDAATHTLQALGNIRSEAATDIGISSLTTYQGFVNKQARFTGGQIDIESQSGSTSGEIVIDGDVTVSSATTFTSGPQRLTVTDTFTLPSGDTNSRELKPTPGSLRFNQDFATLEFYTGNNWATVNTFTEMQNSPGNRGRGLNGGGHSYVSIIQAWEIATLGNATMFGDLTNARAFIAGNVANETRGIFGGGRNPAVHTNRIDYVTIASQGNAIDFGDQSRAFMASGGMSSSTRGIFAGGYAPSLPDLDMEYIQISTLGDALDFGDLFVGAYYSGTACSPVRGVYAGGNNPSGSVATIQNLTIASLGNMVKFGDLTVSRLSAAGGGNSVRGIFCGGQQTPQNIYGRTIDYVTIASEGKAINFGEASPASGTGVTQRSGSGSNQTRAVWVGGLDPNTSVDIMEFVTISTRGNTQDFGNLAEPQRAAGTLSDSHGGLGGF